MSAGRRRRRALLAALALLLAGCGGVLDPRGPIADQELTILTNSVVVMLAVVVPVIVLAFAFGWWFRASNARAAHLPDWSYSGRIEFVVWSVPALVVLFLGGIAWIGSHDLEPSRPIESGVPPLQVEVVALDWKWLFVYPAEGVASLNRLVIPAGTPVSFRLTSAGVMNSFLVPQLGSQIYAMAGMTTRLNLLADEPGTYRGLAAHYNGAGFSDMRFDTVAVPAEAFGGWVAEARAGGGGTLDAGRLAELARPSTADPPATFAAVAPGLFDSVVHGAMGSPPGPAPAPAIHSVVGERQQPGPAQQGPAGHGGAGHGGAH